MRVYGKYHMHAGAATLSQTTRHVCQEMQHYRRYVHATGCDMIIDLHPLHMHAKGSCFMVRAPRMHHTNIRGDQIPGTCMAGRACCTHNHNKQKSYIVPQGHPHSAMHQ
jgi:hypothetical protein